MGGLIENKATTYDTIEGLNGDFFENYLGYNAWYNEKTQMPGQARGSGLIAIPGAHSGGAVLNYRQDILDKYHIPVPQTWEEFNEAAKKSLPQKVEFMEQQFMEIQKDFSPYSIGTIGWFH